MFKFEPSKITREVLLNAKSEEEYFSFYGISPQKGLFKSPLRADHNPTCSFYRNSKGVLKFKDFGTGDNWDFIQLVMHRFGVDYGKALKIIANDIGIINKEKYERHDPIQPYNHEVVESKGQCIIQCELKEYSSQELQWWGTFGIKESTLKKFKVFSVKHVFLNGDLFCTSSEQNPIYGYYFGKKDGIENWKIYFPFKKKFRFLLNCSEIQGLSKLPEKGEYVVVTKSLKDVMTLYELGIPAIAPQAESVVISEDIYNKIASRFKNVIFNGDWDRAGKLYMIKSTNKYKGHALTFKYKSKHAKDISDFVMIHGFERAIKLVDALKERFESGVYKHQLTRWERKKEHKEKLEFQAVPQGGPDLDMS